MADGAIQVSVKPVEQPLNLIPVGLKEAALDSPTFRASSAHFEDQIDIIERWLDNYIRSASRLISELNSLELTVNAFLTHSAPPNQISEAILDHDYTLLAIRRYGEGAREFWNQTFRGYRKYDHAILEPIRGFLNNDLRAFKDTRRLLDLQQKSYDAVIARYLSQSKTKEASSLREDAFQLHEAKKAYLKASMEYCVSAPQVRASLDQLIVRIFTDQFKDMKNGRDATAATFSRLNGEVERIKGWSKEMESSERAFKRELVIARKQIEDNALDMIKPSRELHDYELSTVPYASIGASTATAKSTGAEKGEKQGWLFLKTLVGKPTRTIWVRRWFYVKNGIFGWLVQGSRSGGVGESEKTGVLLCGIRPATQEERRFCFEVKTKDTSIVLQAESQPELTDWITSFEFAKRKALQNPASTEVSAAAAGLDPAFAVTPPVAPEFAARMGDTERGEDTQTGLSIPGSDSTGLGIQQRASFDVAASRRVASIDRDGESSTSRIISKLDLHKRPGNSPQIPQTMPAAGGIASLISASHNAMPISPATSQGANAEGVSGVMVGTGPKRHFTMTLSTLAPNSLANPPAPTSLSHTAVVVSGERNVSLASRADGSGMPGGIMANLWGSSNWGYVNRLTDEVAKSTVQKSTAAPTRPPLPGSSSVDDVIVMDGQGDIVADKPALTAPGADLAAIGHRKTSSAAAITDSTHLPSQIARPSITGVDDFPKNYPLSLKAQYAQFRVLFPSVSRTEKLVMVFRASWNPNEQQEFPGRVYVTTSEIYIYSHHLGFVLITGVSLTSITDVTAAPGRDCDFVYLHLKEANRLDDRKRITVKVFLDPLRLLQRRLNYLVQNANSNQPASLEEVINMLLKMEAEKPRRSSSADSWEPLGLDADDAVAGDEGASIYQRERNVKASLRIDGNLYGESARTGREIQRFQLPRHPVVYAPQDMQRSVTREFNVSAKALFHVMYGDKSAVFQLLYCNRWGDKITQTPWVINATEHWQRRFTSETSPIQDHQTIDIANDHLCYLVTNNRLPWRLPYSSRFHLTTKLVITHVAKSRCKLAIFQRISWYRAPGIPYIKHLIEKLALNTLEADALDLTNVIMDQEAKLGNHSRTNKAIEVFGNIGQQTSVPQLDANAMPDLTIAPALALGAANRMQRVSLFRLVSSDLMVKLLRAVSMGFDIFIALCRGAVRMCTAHTLLLGLLFFSALYNAWHGYRDGLVSWHERSATRYMARMGVKPNSIMGRGIYLSDIDELIAPPSSIAMVNGSSLSFTTFETEDVGTKNKTCRSTFTEEVMTDLPHHAGAGARLFRSRGALARYRHDLLVALRVVNSVEKDVVLSEWEEWVRGEERKCVKIGNVLGIVEGGRDGSHGSEGGLDELRRYCDSCRAEVSGLRTGSGLM